MPGPKDVPVGGGSFVNVMLARLRRRSLGVGRFTLLLPLLALAALFLTLCACKNLLRGSTSPP